MQYGTEWDHTVDMPGVTKEQIQQAREKDLYWQETCTETDKREPCFYCLYACR